jgi:hypothetical protein
MNCSIRDDTPVSWFAAVMFAIALMYSQTAQAIEPGAALSDVLAALDGPAGSPAIVTPGRDPADSRAQVERALQGDGSGTQTVAKPRRAYLRNSRLRREEERARREAGAAPWHSGRWSTGLILGVGF